MLKSSITLFPLIFKSMSITGVTTLWESCSNSKQTTPPLRFRHRLFGTYSLQSSEQWKKSCCVTLLSNQPFYGHPESARPSILPLSTFVQFHQTIHRSPQKRLNLSTFLLSALETDLMNFREILAGTSESVSSYILDTYLERTIMLIGESLKCDEWNLGFFSFQRIWWIPCWILKWRVF